MYIYIYMYMLGALVSMPRTCTLDLQLRFLWQVSCAGTGALGAVLYFAKRQRCRHGILQGTLFIPSQNKVQIGLH